LSFSHSTPPTRAFAPTAACITSRVNKCQSISDTKRKKTVVFNDDSFVLYMKDVKYIWIVHLCLYILNQKYILYRDGKYGYLYILAMSLELAFRFARTVAACNKWHNKFSTSAHSSSSVSL
jgi:hypothetical protein